MFCLNCGTQLPDDANFCYKCGKPVGQGAQPSEEIQWEHCQICHNVKRGLFSAEFWFWAEAVGPKGKYSAGESPHYKATKMMELQPGDKKEGPRAREAHNKLVQMLISDGWEPVSGRGEWWWELRFRRKVKRTEAHDLELALEGLEDQVKAAEDRLKAKSL